jgi:glucose/arabinose dehydrogenase
VPSDNPFVGTDGADEIWSYGLRNPWRFSFDACTGDLYIGDVGQTAEEEVDFEPVSVPGRNYGWRCAEGERVTDNACGGIDRGNFVEPIASYGRGVGRSITGGYVYRGSVIPALRGTYLYADYSSARFFALRMAGGVLVEGSAQEITDNLNPGGAIESISSFASTHGTDTICTTWFP